MPINVSSRAGPISSMGRGQRYSTSGRNSYYDRLMDQRADDRRFQQRLALSGAGSDETPGQWIDPLAIGPGATPAERVQQRAQLKRRDRKRRLGRPEQATEQYYKSGSQIEQEQEQTDLNERRSYEDWQLKEKQKHEAGVLEEGREHDAGLAGAAAWDAALVQRDEDDEEDIGGGAYTKSDAEDLRKHNRTRAIVRKDPRLSDDERERQLLTLKEARDEILTRRKAPLTPDEQFENDTIVRDGNVMQQNEQGKWEVITGFVTPEAKAAEQKEEADAAQQEADDERRATYGQAYKNFKASDGTLTLPEAIAEQEAYNKGEKAYVGGGTSGGTLDVTSGDAALGKPTFDEGELALHPDYTGPVMSSEGVGVVEWAENGVVIPGVGDIIREAREGSTKAQEYLDKEGIPWR